MKLLSIILVFSITIFFFAGEGIIFQGKKNIGKAIRFMAFVCGLLIWVYVPYDYLLLLIGVLFALMFSPYVWNLSAGQRLGYQGKGWYDKNIGRIILIAPVWFLLAFWLIILILKYI